MPAFLLELACYLAPGFAAVRKIFDELGSRPARAALLALSAVIPYLIESPMTGTFRLQPFLILIAVSAAASFWYVWIRRSLPADLLFLAFLGAVYLSKLFEQTYGQPAPHVSLAILGRLMWIRLNILAVFSLRSIDDPRFGFLPTRKEWRTGAMHYLYFLPVGGAIAYLVRFAGFHPPALAWWKFGLLAAATFFAFLWVVALFEEFFFRAFLQRMLSSRLHSDLLGLILASLLFGLAHLWFRAFPNWRLSGLAAAAGVFYGLAFQKAGSVRASMVTHALVVTTWRLFLA